MTDDEALAYVHAAAAMLAVPMDGSRAARVALHLQRTAALARVIEAVPLAVGDEPAELYRPAPFAGTGDTSNVPLTPVESC